MPGVFSGEVCAISGLLRVWTCEKHIEGVGLRYEAVRGDFDCFQACSRSLLSRLQTAKNILHQNSLSLRTSQDAFYKKLRASDDGFAVITEYLGKGVLNCTSVSGAEF